MTVGGDGVAGAPAAAALAAAAQRWLDSLGEGQREWATFAFDDAERFAWGFVPGDRTGLALGEMADPQREAALGLVRAAMSARGATEVEAVIALEPILGEIERMQGRGNWTRRESGRYWLAVYGDPGGHDPWAWRIEGHHVSVRSTVAEGRVVGVTPCFLGANPATVPADAFAGTLAGPREGAIAGRRTLDGEESLARALLAALSPGERSIAVVDPIAPPEILSGTGRLVDGRGLPGGIPRDQMGPSGQAALDRLIGHYLGRVTAEVDEAAWARVRDAGIDDVSFAWAGGEQPGQGHYYAIQGSCLLIEYDNTQNGANHIHSVWRDPTNDWGDDLLAAHYRAAHGA